MGPISLWISALGIPIAAFAGNAFVRWLRKMPQSAAADLLLLLVVFDSVVIIQSDVFKKFVVDPVFRNDIVAIRVLLLVFGGFMWTSCVVGIEQKISASFNQSTKTYSDFPLWLWILSW